MDNVSKKIIKIVLLVALIVLHESNHGMPCKSASSLEQTQFKASKAEEFQEAVAYCVQHKKLHETHDDVVRNIKSGSKRINYPSDIFFLPQVYDWSSSMGYDFEDLQKTFDTLKIMMKIPKEVEIMFASGPAITDNALMGYVSQDRTVYIYPVIFDGCSRSYRLFTLIHELTHVLQHAKMGLLNFHLFPLSLREHEADSQAAQAIKCHTCMQAIEAEQLLGEATIEQEKIDQNKAKGYLIGKDISACLQTKSMHDLCDFHKNNKQFQATSLQEIIDIDFHNGPLYDRLSTVSFESFFKKY